MENAQTENSSACGASELADVLGKLPDATLWMTRESKWRLSNGGNSKGAVPVHGKPSATAKVPLYTEEQMQAERERCFALGRNAGLPNAI